LAQLARPSPPALARRCAADLDLVDPATGLVHNGEAIDALVDWPQSYNDSMVQSPWNAVVQVRAGLLYVLPFSLGFTLPLLSIV
jgi:hypothetical protein